jgi:hypothetical protein
LKISNYRSPIEAGIVVPLIGLAVGIAIFAWLRIHPSGERAKTEPQPFDYSLDAYWKVDPKLVHYRQVMKIPLAMQDSRGVAVGPDDRIFVAGDKMIQIFSPDGKKLRQFELTAEPRCLAVAGAKHVAPGRLYVGMNDRVEVYDDQGKPLAVWSRPDKRSVLASIAVSEEDIFVGDAGALAIWHYDPQGKFLGAIGKRDKSNGISGFVCPSPNLDVAIAPDGLLRVTNPGEHRVEAYTFDGHLELSWGRNGMGIETFCGCCGPSNIAILADGRVVTAEKGIPRVKVYSPTGQFECIVVGPDTLAPNLSKVQTCDEHHRRPVDLAVDSRGRVLVLDPASKSLQIYEHK